MSPRLCLGSTKQTAKAEGQLAPAGTPALTRRLTRRPWPEAGTWEIMYVFCLPLSLCLCVAVSLCLAGIARPWRRALARLCLLHPERRVRVSTRAFTCVLTARQKVSRAHTSCSRKGIETKSQEGVVAEERLMTEVKAPQGCFMGVAEGRRGGDTSIVIL